MDLRALTPRTLALLDTAAGDALLPFVRDAYSEGFDVDLQVVRVGPTHELAALAAAGERIVREGSWRLPRTSELPQHVAAAVLLAYVTGLEARVARVRARHGL